MRWPMSEVRWYDDCARLGRHPRARRVSRQSAEEALRASIDLAIDIVRGRASDRPRILSATGEEYWYWPDRPGSDTGWWIVPGRIVDRARDLHDAAVRTAIRRRRPGSPPCDFGDVRRVLLGWRESGKYRTMAAKHRPKHTGMAAFPGRPPKRKIKWSARLKKLPGYQAHIQLDPRRLP